MAYMDNGRFAPFGAITIYRVTTALGDAFARVQRWAGADRRELDRFSPAELEDIGLSIADVTAPRSGIFAQLGDGLRAWNARRRTVVALSRLSDAQLDDIGLTRYDVEELRSGHVPY